MQRSSAENNHKSEDRRNTKHTMDTDHWRQRPVQKRSPHSERHVAHKTSEANTMVPDQKTAKPATSAIPVRNGCKPGTSQDVGISRPTHPLSVQSLYLTSKQCHVTSHQFGDFPEWSNGRRDRSEALFQDDNNCKPLPKVEKRRKAYVKALLWH